MDKCRISRIPGAIPTSASHRSRAHSISKPLLQMRALIRQRAPLVGNKAYEEAHEV